MTPRTATANVSNDMLRLTDCFGNLGNVFVRHVEGHNLPSNILRKAIVVQPLPFGHLPCVPSWVVNGRLACSSSFDRILSVMFLVPPSKVGRVAARWVVAGVERVRQAFGGWTVPKEARHARRDNFNATGLTVSNGKEAVAFPVPRLGNPRPTFVLRPNFYLAPKSIDIFCTKLEHAASHGSLDEAYHRLGG